MWRERSLKVVLVVVGLLLSAGISLLFNIVFRDTTPALLF